MSNKTSAKDVIELSQVETKNLIIRLQESLEKIKKSLNHYFEAEKYFENDSFQMAYKACKSAIDLNVEDQVITLALSNMLSKIQSKLNENSDAKVSEAEKEFKDEIKKYEELIEKQKRDKNKCESNCLAKSYLNLSLAWHKWGEFLYENEAFIEAEEKYEKALKENTNGLEMHCNDIDLNIHRAHLINGMALIHKNQMQYLKALSKFNEAIKLYEEILTIQKKKNSQSLIIGNIKEDFAKTYINISNTNKDLGNSYYSAKKYKDALGEYNRAILMIQKSLEIFVTKYAYLDLSYLYECAANAVRMINTI